MLVCALLSVCLSIYLSIYLSVCCIYAYLSIYCLYICVSICPSICLSVCLSIRLSKPYSSICVSHSMYSSYFRSSFINTSQVFPSSSTGEWSYSANYEPVSNKQDTTCLKYVENIKTNSTPSWPCIRYIQVLQVISLTFEP